LYTKIAEEATWRFNDMAIVRCAAHPVRLYLARNTYVRMVEPLGYPNTAAICGIGNCMEPGLVWLTNHEVDKFNKGERYFRVKTYTVKVRVRDTLMPLP
jgi:hypothetical protein